MLTFKDGSSLLWPPLCSLRGFLFRAVMGTALSFVPLPAPGAPSTVNGDMRSLSLAFHLLCCLVRGAPDWQKWAILMTNENLVKNPTPAFLGGE